MLPVRPWLRRTAWRAMAMVAHFAVLQQSTAQSYQPPWEERDTVGIWMRSHGNTLFLHSVATWVQQPCGKSVRLEIRRSQVQILARSWDIFQDNDCLFSSLFSTFTFRGVFGNKSQLLNLRVLSQEGDGYMILRGLLSNTSFRSEKDWEKQYTSASSWCTRGGAP